MRVLVVGPNAANSPKSATTGATPEAHASAASTLADLGCDVAAVPLWAEVDGAAVGRGVDLLLVETPDAPEVGAYELRRLRKVRALAEVPALLAVSAASVQRIDFGAGFSDFILVPYVPQELYARVRQTDWKGSAFSGEEIVKLGDLVIDVAGHEVRAAGRPVSLTRQEFELLLFLARNRGRVFAREQLLRKAWGVSHYGSSRTVDVHVRRLRQKLGRAGDPIETLRGVGYRMRGEP